MLISAGGVSVARGLSVSGGGGASVSRGAACPRAWTPASVRPEPYSSNCVTRVTSRLARSTSPCTVRAFRWICQPLYRVPAYSIVSLSRMRHYPCSMPRAHDARSIDESYLQTLDRAGGAVRRIHALPGLGAQAA